MTKKIIFKDVNKDRKNEFMLHVVCVAGSREKVMDEVMEVLEKNNAFVEELDFIPISDTNLDFDY